MSTYCIGDWVFVRVSTDKTLIFDVPYDEPSYTKFEGKLFLLIGKIGKEYVLKVNSLIEDRFVINQTFIDKFNIDKKYLHDNAYLVKESSLGGRQTPDYYKAPISCCLCNTSVPYAIPNIKDKFVCYSCRTDPRNKFKLENI